MTKTLYFILGTVFFGLIVLPAYSQSFKYEDNPSYGPGPKSSYISVAKRLSYENFRNIKLMHTAMMNFGGGEAEIDTLIDQYAEASALYFQNKTKESAKLFLQNETAILKAAQKLAKRYNDDANVLVTQATKMKVRNAIKLQISGKGDNRLVDTYYGYAAASVSKGHDYYVRYKDATNANSRNLLTAIYYFRRAKSNIFQMIKILKIDENKKREMLAKYKRDMVDNKNIVYTHKEKKN